MRPLKPKPLLHSGSTAPRSTPESPESDRGFATLGSSHKYTRLLLPLPTGMNPLVKSGSTCSPPRWGLEPLLRKTCYVGVRGLH